MTAPIIYYDNGSIRISEAKAATLKSYIKVYLNQRDECKLVEYIDDCRVTGMGYFVDADETVSEIFKQYPGFEYITFYRNKEKRNGFAKYEVDMITRSGNIINKRIQVLADTLLPVYDKAMEVNNGSILFFAKYFYDYTNNITYEFEYNSETGELIKITVEDPTHYFDTDEYSILPSQIGKGNNPFNFNWDGLEYYQSAACLP